MLGDIEYLLSTIDALRAENEKMKKVNRDADRENFELREERASLQSTVCGLEDENAAMRDIIKNVKGLCCGVEWRL